MARIVLASALAHRLPSHDPADDREVAIDAPAATVGEALEAVFARIDQMRKAPLKRVKPDPIDYFQPFAITGLSLGGLYLLSLFGLRYTPW